MDTDADPESTLAGQVAELTFLILLLGYKDVQPQFMREMILYTAPCTLNWMRPMLPLNSCWFQFASTTLGVHNHTAPPKNIRFDIAVRETKQAQQKHVRAVLSVEKNPVTVRGLFAGTGKSFICQRCLIEIIKLSSFVLLTDYYRNLTEGETMTTRFFGISFGDAKLIPFDWSEFAVVVFDDINFW